MTIEEAISMRLINLQLQAPRWDEPEKIIYWMGAMQAQDYTHFRWAVGMRMKKPNMKAVREAYSSGKILRLHLLRCTIQAITPADYHWMIALCRERNLRTIQSWPSCNKVPVSDSYIQEATEVLKGLLAQKKSMNKKEISKEFSTLGLPSDTAHLTPVILRGEINGLLCSGAMEGKDATWALTSEWVKAPYDSAFTTTEALTLLARKYFRSHSPASFEDFCWWSGIPITQSRQAIQSISAELETIKIGNQEMFVYKGNVHPSPARPELILLPPYDEYLVGYKSRHIALDKKHESKAYNKFGIFKPVMLYQGKVVGNWNAQTKAKTKNIDTEIFISSTDIDKGKVQEAIKLLQDFG